MNVQNSISLPLQATIHANRFHVTGARFQTKLPFSSEPPRAYNTTVENNETTQNAFSILEMERVKIGHELHDNVNQLLAVAKLHMDSITTLNPKEQLAKREAISFILMAIQGIREISSELVVSQKMEFNLPEMITDLAKKMNATGIFKVRSIVKQKEGLKKLCNEKKISLYRIAQEQINNAIKYSKSDLVSIFIILKKGMVSLKITDNGVGFDTTKSTKGIGLTNIENRVKDLKGFLEIKSAPGKGCHLHVCVPASIA